MKLLFLTQVLDADDAVLGFVLRWVQGFARHCEAVRVVALEAGELEGLPENASVRTVGREGRVRRFLRYRKHLAEAFAEGYDTVLAHMVPRYSLLSAGPARRAGARSFLWYTHKGVDGRLRRAEGLVEKIFTASEESLRLATDKKVVTGHGIDLEHFGLGGVLPEHPPRLLSVGRLTPAKDPLTVLAAFEILLSRGHDLHLDWVGGGLAAGDGDTRRRVEEQLSLGAAAGRVHLHDMVPYPEVPRAYQRSSVFLSASLTGSVDKVVLEAMACGRPVVTCNESFPPIFAELGEDAALLSFPAGDAGALADRIEALLALDEARRASLGLDLRGLVERDHEVERLMARLVAEMGAPR